MKLAFFLFGKLHHKMMLIVYCVFFFIRPISRVLRVALLYHYAVTQLTVIGTWLTLHLPRKTRLVVKTQTGSGCTDLTCSILYWSIHEQKQSNTGTLCIIHKPKSNKAEAMFPVFSIILTLMRITTWKCFVEKLKKYILIVVKFACVSYKRWFLAPLRVKFPCCERQPQFSEQDLTTHSHHAAGGLVWSGEVKVKESRATIHRHT